MRWSVGPSRFNAITRRTRFSSEGPLLSRGLHEHFPGAPLRMPGRDIERPVESFEFGDSAGVGRWSAFVDAFEPATAPTPTARLSPAIRVSRAETRRRATVLHDVVIHIRRGLDFGQYGWVLPLEYHDRALSVVGTVGQIHICGVHLDDDLREHFADRRPVYYEGSPLGQFQFLQQFDRIVLSNDTLAWWVAFLSAARVVVGPRAVNDSGYAFTGFRGVELHMRQSRYRELEVPVFSHMDWRVTSGMRGALLYASESDLVVAVPGQPVRRGTLSELNRQTLMWIPDRGELTAAECAHRFPGDDTWPLVQELA